MSGQDTHEREPSVDETNYQAWLAKQTKSPAAGSALAAFTEETDIHGDTNRSFLGKLLLVLIPILLLLGYYTYVQVQGATTIDRTLTTSVDLDRGLVGHWTFDGESLSSTTATDRSGQGNNGTVTNGPSRTIGAIGQGIGFDGVNDFVTRSDNASLDLPVSHTLAAWVRLSSITDGLILSKGLCGSNYSSYALKVGTNDGGGTAGRLNYTIRNANLVGNNTVSQTSNLPTNTWVHVAGTHDGTTMRLYINGALHATATGNGSAPYNNPDPLLLGSDSDCSTGRRYQLNGTLDDVRTYTRTLSAAEIERLYKLGEGTKINVTDTPPNLETGLVGHWTFDGPNLTTATATDSSGQGNSGSLISGPTRVVGKIGQALTFDGSSSFIDAGNPAPLNLSDENRFSLAAWVYPTAAPNGVGVISEMYNPTNTTVQYEIGFDIDLGVTPGSKLSVGFFNGSWRIIKDSADVSLNKWVFITGTWDGSMLRLYKDAIQVTSATPGGSLPATNYDKVVIGKRHDTAGLTNFFPGRIDDVRIYNRALSAAEVRQLYELGGGATVEICRESSVQDADGGTYNTLAIGSQCWLDRNMNVGTRIAAATTQTNNGIIEKYCYSNSDANCTTNNPTRPDGGLYQWNEAMQYSTTEGARGICPIGFHIPTDAEWHILEKFLANSGQSCNLQTNDYQCRPAGAKLQPGGSSRFEGNRAGFSISGSFFNRGDYGNWWSSSPSGGSAWDRFVESGEARLFRNAFPQSYGLSVRCLQDS